MPSLRHPSLLAPQLCPYTCPTPLGLTPLPGLTWASGAPAPWASPSGFGTAQTCLLLLRFLPTSLLSAGNWEPGAGLRRGRTRSAKDQSILLCFFCLLSPSEPPSRDLCSLLRPSLWTPRPTTVHSLAPSLPSLCHSAPGPWGLALPARSISALFALCSPQCSRGRAPAAATPLPSAPHTCPRC